jgi:PAS domain S-box-containing protein
MIPNKLNDPLYIRLIAIEILLLLLGGLVAVLFQRGFFAFAVLILIFGLPALTWIILKFLPLSDKNTLFQALFNQGNDAVFLMDLQGNIIAANSFAVKLLGYSLEELLTMSFRHLADRSELPSSENVLETLTQGRIPPIYERNLRSKTGEKIPVEINVQLVRDSKGQALHLQSIVRDIRQRKKVELALQTSEKQLRTLVSALPDRAVVLDKDGYYREVFNADSITAMRGMNLSGKHVSEIGTPEFAQFCIDMVRKTLEADSPQSFEYEYKLDDETIHYFDGRTVPYTDIESGEKLVFWMSRNITERKTAAQEIKDSESRLRYLVRYLPDRAIILDRKGQFHEIVKEDYESVHASNDTRSVRQGQFLHDIYTPEFAQFCMDKIRETLDANKPLSFQYNSPLRKDYQLEARLIPYIDPKTKEERVFWVTRDITERLLAERQRLELSLAEEKVAFLRQFVDSITHDLKTPITVIGTSLHLLERSPDAQKRQERIAIMRKQLGTLTHMVDELLAVARLDEIPQLDFAPVDFYTILEEVVEFLRPKAELKQINLTVNLAQTSPRISAAHDELSRAISNLIDNAIKYTPNNGRVTVKVLLEGKELVFEVQDTGIGMSPTEMERVFERFFRTDRARSEAPGTGLGLEITRRIIELHGGRISLESEVNQGTTFRVWIPLKLDENELLELKT